MLGAAIRHLSDPLRHPRNPRGRPPVTRAGTDNRCDTVETTYYTFSSMHPPDARRKRESAIAHARRARPHGDRR